MIRQSWKKSLVKSHQGLFLWFMNLEPQWFQYFSYTFHICRSIYLRNAGCKINLDFVNSMNRCDCLFCICLAMVAAESLYPVADAVCNSFTVSRLLVPESQYHCIHEQKNKDYAAAYIEPWCRTGAAFRHL